jgi:hypothetical protein
MMNPKLSTSDGNGGVYTFVHRHVSSSLVMNYMWTVRKILDFEITAAFTM